MLLFVVLEVLYVAYLRLGDGYLFFLFRDMNKYFLYI